AAARTLRGAREPGPRVECRAPAASRRAFARCPRRPGDSSRHAVRTAIGSPVMTRLGLALPSAALVAALPGCGGGGGEDRLSKSDYETQVGTIAVDLTAAIQKIGAATTVKATMTALEQAQTTFERSADQMDAIMPPKEIESEHDALTAAVREFGEELNPIMARAPRPNRLPVP